MITTSFEVGLYYVNAGGFFPSTIPRLAAASVKEQALFWLGESGSDEALHFFDELLMKRESAPHVLCRRNKRGPAHHGCDMAEIAG